MTSSLSDPQTAVPSSTTNSNTTTVSTAKPAIEIATTAYLDQQAYVQGTFPISLGPDVIIHPRARLLSFLGPLTIGAGSIVSERCVVGGPGPVDPKGRVPAAPRVPLETVIGRDVALHASVELEAGCTLEDACLVEPRAAIRKGVRVGSHSKVCAAAVVDRSVGGWMVVLGDGQNRRLRVGAEDPENGRLLALKREREATVSLLKAAAARTTLGKRRG